jgi:cyclopropane-fatty-acyl-phospholipid synthase
MLFARSLRRIVRHGTLIVIDADKRQHVFGDNAPPAVTIRLHDRRLHWQLFLNLSLELGEAYMDCMMLRPSG